MSGSQGHKNSEYGLLRHAHTHLPKDMVFKIFALIWNFMQCRFIVTLPMFRTTYRSHLQWSSRLPPEDGIDTLSWNAG